MSGGAHRRQRGAGGRTVAIVLALLVIAALGAGAWWFFLRDGAPLDFGGDRAVPEFSFELIKVRGTSVEGRVPADELADPAEDVRATLDALYTAGFVDPSKWEGGEFPEVLELFEGRAARAAGKDLDALTLGQDATTIDFVEPFNGRLTLRFLLDADQEPVAAIAQTVFGANATAKGGGPVAIQHAATYFLTPGDDGWAIVGYDTEGVVAPVDRPLSPRAGPEASP
jgi:hypothetical protein